MAPLSYFIVPNSKTTFDQPNDLPSTSTSLPTTTSSSPTSPPHPQTKKKKKETKNSNPAILLAPVPLLLTTALTSPFVNSIYLHLPLYARQSRQLLHRFAASPPPETLLDVRTVRLNGFWKTTGTTVGELRPLPPRGFLGGLANVERVPRVGKKAAVKKETAGKEEDKEKKRLWDVDGDKRGLLQRFATLFVEPRRRFYISPAEGSRRSAEPGVIELVMKAVEKQHS